jgi:alkanesulfonate monooxygenase SsuD/methylene tetrahydromethanopterin reductase-like flavin-dependent oxidoreductase (luciferase family)
MFMEFGFRAERDDSRAFADGFALVDAAEQWGLDSAWVAEFHFNADRSVLSSPIVTATAMAARTQRMRIGTAVYVLPLTNPLRVAEEVSTLDQISNGRFEFGIGRSGFRRAYDTYGLDYDESTERLNEAVALIREAWKGERFTFSGKYFQANDALVVPQPVQKPYPPMRIAAASPKTYISVAQEGSPLFVGLRGDGLEELSGMIQTYRESWRKAGHLGEGSVYLRVPVYAAATTKLAQEQARESIEYYFARQSRLVSNTGGNTNQRQQLASTLAELSYDDILADRVAFGSARYLIERLAEWHETLGIDGIVAETNAGGMLSTEQELNSLRILTHDVMPAFK